MIDPSPLKRGLGAAIGATAILASTAGSALAAPTNQPGWTATVQNITTGVQLGYETAIDPVQRVLYAADASGGTYQRDWVWDPALNSGAGGYSDKYVQTTITSPTGRIASLSTANHTFLKYWSFTGLTGADGTTIGGPLTWPTTIPASGRATASNNNTGQYPYGVAVDYKTTNGSGQPDPTIVTVQTRTSSVAIYKASAAQALKDTDLIQPAASGLVRARTPVVDSTRHKAYVAGYNASTGSVVQFNTQTKAVEATITVPGAVGLALDEANNLLYAGIYPPNGGEKAVKVIDLSKVNTGDPLNKTLNDGAVVATITGVGDNARPGFDAVGKKLYTANSESATPTVSVIDLDPASANFRKVIKTIEVPGRPNAVNVDGERGLVYVPTLTGRSVAVIDARTLEYVTSVATTGSAVDADVDPASGVVYVSSQRTNVNGDGQIQAIKISRPTDALTNGKDGAPGPAGAAGPAGKDGLNSLALELSSLKLLGSKLSFTAPGAGVLNVKVTSAGRTIATGKRTAAKAGEYSLTLSKTKYGKDKLKQKKSVKGTLTATFTAAGSTAKVQKSIKASLRR